MEPYRNTDSDSGIAAYESGPGFIKLQFGDGSIYLYTNESTGAEHIEAMQRLAVVGNGLNTFLNKYVRDRYERREQ
jgi:hypothetical protein